MFVRRHDPESTRPPAWISRAALAGILLFAAAAILYWVRIDETPPYWDEAWYMAQGLAQMDAIRIGDLRGWYDTWTLLDPSRPSLVPFLTIPFYLVLGHGADSAMGVNVVAFLVMLGAVYALGLHMRDRTVALCAALLVGSYPLLIGLAHILMTEATMTAIVALTLLALWQSEGFRHTGWTILTGVFGGLGVLSKVFFPVFVLGPLVVCLLLAWHRTRTDPQSGRQHVANLLLALIPFLILAGSWYLPNAAPMLERSLDAAIGGEGLLYGPANPWHPRNLLHFLASFALLRVSLAGSIIFVVASFGIISQWYRLSVRDRWAINFLLSSALPAYVLFMGMPNQDPKNVVGLLPAFALLSAWGFTAIIRNQTIAIALVAILFLFNTVNSSFQIGGLAQWNVVHIGSWAVTLFPVAEPDKQNPAFSAPGDMDWPLKEIMDYALLVADLETLAHDELLLGVVPNAAAFEEHAFRFAAASHQMPVEARSANQMNLQRFDVVVAKTGDQGWDASILPSIDEANRALASQDFGFFELPRRFPLPDGSDALIYSRKDSPLARAPVALETTVDACFGNAAKLLGVDTTTFSNPDETTLLRITTYWETMSPTKTPLSLFVHAVNPTGGDGNIMAQNDHVLFAATYPSTWWAANVHVTDTTDLLLPAVSAGERLVLLIGLYDTEGRVPVVCSPETVEDNAIDLEISLR